MKKSLRENASFLRFKNLLNFNFCVSDVLLLCSELFLDSKDGSFLFFLLFISSSPFHFHSIYVCLPTPALSRLLLKRLSTHTHFPHLLTAALEWLEIVIVEMESFCSRNIIKILLNFWHFKKQGKDPGKNRG